MKNTRIFSSIAGVLASVAAAVVLLTSSLVFADGHSRSGTFTGLSNHVTTGDVSVVSGADGVQIVLAANFSFDGAPDPKVALGKDGEYDPATLIEPLRSNSGEQTYQVPASINAADYNEVYIWCEKFSVGLGVATLSSP